MTLQELNNILKSTGYKVAYSHFNTPVKAPFITYLISNSENFIADNKVYKKIDNIKIELYTSIKDLQAEEKLEKLLDENEMPYECSEEWIEKEKVFQRIYEVELI